MLTIKDFTFAYPEQKNILKNINLTIRPGEFVVLCGTSGCGKTTLLCQIKREIRPHGKRSGEISINGRLLESMTEKESAATIGYVSQNADNQVVTDKVWHEVAFGLENLGYKEAKIRNRVAEMASFFGMSDWFHQGVTELSGGQLQKLCLASVLVMRPDIILLDEPVSKLDPIASLEFIQLLRRINRELNTTILMTEHNLSDVFYYADRILYMEDGKICFDDEPYEAVEKLAEYPIFHSLPIEVQVAYHQGFHMELRKKIRFKDAFSQRFYQEDKEEVLIQNRKRFFAKKEQKKQVVLELRDVYFSYQPKKEVLKDISLQLFEEDCLAILGANGCGKSTLLGILSGIIKNYHGKRRCKKRIAFLTQDVQTIFAKKTVQDDLMMLGSSRYDEIVQLFGLEKYLKRHPYDLSGGEQQIVAIAKTLLTDADLYVLDEPTKGIDCVLKEKCAHMIQSELSKGKTFVIVTHDIEFAAKYTSRAMMMFQGEVMGVGSTREILLGNSFYTTALNRLLGKEYRNLLIEEDVELSCKKRN